MRISRRLASHRRPAVCQNPRGRGRHPLPLQPHQIHVYRADILGCRVMQLTRDPAAFLVLRAEQSGRELPQFFLCRLRVRDIAHDHQDVVGVKRHTQRFIEAGPLRRLNEKRHRGRLSGIRCVLHRACDALRRVLRKSVPDVLSDDLFRGRVQFIPFVRGSSRALCLHGRART